jgi:hypothetical protein
MDFDDMPHSSSRDTYMVIVLCIVVGLPLFVFFNIITFGLFIALFALALCVAGLAALNYLLWGRAFTRATAWEREEAEFRDQLADQEWSEESSE